MPQNQSAVKPQPPSVPAADTQDSFCDGLPEDHNSVSNLDNAEPDRAESNSHQTNLIPYSRFKEVIDERNELRKKLDSVPVQLNSTPVNLHNSISDSELNLLWDENPAQAARIMFSSMFEQNREKERRTDQYLEQTIARYPELADPNHEIISLAREIITAEMPDLSSDPRGLSIATELAAARYYRDRYTTLEKNTNLSLKSLEATRSANLKNAFMEHGNNAPLKSSHASLSAEETHIAAMMGISPNDYAHQKRNKKGGK